MFENIVSQFEIRNCQSMNVTYKSVKGITISHRRRLSCRTISVPLAASSTVTVTYGAKDGFQLAIHSFSSDTASSRIDSSPYYRSNDVLVAYLYIYADARSVSRRTG